MLAGLALPVAILALLIGGLSYRQDCIAADGASISSHWSFTILAPIPYLFRPSKTGCETHTGTRVALDAIGIGGFGKPSPGRIVDAAANGESKADAYWTRLRFLLDGYFKAIPGIRDFQQADELVRGTISQLARLTPPEVYRSAHAALQRAMRQGLRDGYAMTTMTDRHAILVLQREDGRAIRNAIASLDRVHSRVSPG